MAFLSAAFGVKSPLTIGKRASAVLRYFRFHQEFIGGLAVPFEEACVFRYFNEMQDVFGKCSAASFLEAMRFSHYVLGIDGALEVTKSLRVSGKSKQLLAQKRLLQQAPHLLVQEVRELHRLLANPEEDLMNRLAAGTFLCLLYSRSRWSDVRQVHTMEYDNSEGNVSFLEINTQVHKTARSAELKAKLLPIVAPSVGVVEDNWIEMFLDVREAVGLPRLGNIDGPLLPAFDDAFFMHRSITSEEASAWLRLLLHCESGGRHPSSHSLKRTVLTWTSKWALTEKHRKS